MSTLQGDDRRLIQDAVEKFIDNDYAFEEKEARLEKSGQYGAHWAQFAELGWLALPFSEEAGGIGGSVADVQLLMQAFGRGLIAEPFAEVVLTAGKTLEYCASTDRVEEYLAPIICGESFSILAHTETRAELDFSAVEAVATTEAGGYRVSGVKRVVQQATVADKYLVTVLLDGEPALLSIDAASDGLTKNEFSTIDSRCSADIHFNDVVVPTTALIASGDVAVAGVKNALLFTLGAMLGEAQGIAHSLRKLTVEYLNTREQFGSKLITFQALQHQLADMVIAEEELTSLAWMAGNAAELEDGEQHEHIIRSAKARAGKIGREMAEIAVQLHGGVGVSDELIVGHYLRRMIAIDATYGDAQQQLLWLANRY